MNKFLILLCLFKNYCFCLEYYNDYNIYKYEFSSYKLSPIYENARNNFMRNAISKYSDYTIFEYINVYNYFAINNNDQQLVYVNNQLTTINNYLQSLDEEYVRNQKKEENIINRIDENSDNLYTVEIDNEEKKKKNI